MIQVCANDYYYYFFKAELCGAVLMHHSTLSNFSSDRLVPHRRAMKQHLMLNIFNADALQTPGSRLLSRHSGKQPPPLV